MTLAAITAATSQLDTSRPADSEMADSAAAAQYIADGCLVDGSVGRIGLELEAHCFDPLDPYRRPSWDEITEVLELLPPLPHGSAVTVEPGGAVELSGPPEDGIIAAIAAMNSDQVVLRQGVRECRIGTRVFGRRPAAVVPARQPGRPLPRHGAVLRREPLR